MKKIAVRAQIATLQGTSGHADQSGLLNWVRGFREKPATVFVNHGDPDACEAFRDLLIAEGYRAEAPYSGAEFDLLSGQAIMLPAGKPVVKMPGAKKVAANPGLVYNSLLTAATELLNVARACKGRRNQDLRKFTDQIKTLIDRWK